MTNSILPPDASDMPGPQYESGGKLYQRIAAQEKPTAIPTEYEGFPRLLQWQIGRQLPRGPVCVEVLIREPVAAAVGEVEATSVEYGRTQVERWNLSATAAVDAEVRKALASALLAVPEED